MEKKKIINSEEFRMKIINFLKIYGYYDGVLVQNGMDLKYVNGEVVLEDVIQNKKDFKILKQSVMKVLDYCYENRFDEIEMNIQYFYQDVCKGIRKKYGSFLERF